MKQGSIFTIIVIMLSLLSFSGATQKRVKNDRRFKSTILEQQSSDTARTIQEKIESSLWDYVYKSRKEKCYLHIDKESCLPGDTIFFRGYLFNSSYNTIVDYSRFIYVELVDRAGVIYTREKISCDSNHTFKGYLPISENVSQGEFFIRAYTYWMQGDKEEYIFRKRIRIISPYNHRIRCEMAIEKGANGRRILKLEFLNTQGERYQNIEFNYKIPGETPDTTYSIGNTGYSGQQRIIVNDSLSDHIWIAFSNNCQWDYEAYLPIPGSRRDYNVTFHPEGGSYVSGQTQRIGIKSLGRDGIGVAVTGNVYDSNGAYITSFSTNSMGIGSFEINGKPLTDYTVITKSYNSLTKQYSLPQFYNSGVSLRLDATGTKVRYRVLGDSLHHIRNSGHVIIHSRGVPLAILELSTTEGRTMDLSSAPSGLIHFVLTDSVGTIFSERLWFNEPQHNNSIKFTLPFGTAERRAMQNVELEFTNTTNPNDSLLFSISVINNGQTLHDSRNGGLPTYLLLDSDIEEFIENPAFYFSSSTRNRAKELDNLMLTLQWKRFNISDILNHRFYLDNHYYMERGQFLSGVVKNFMGKPVVNAEILIIGSNGIVRESTTDSTGRFIENDIWYDENTRFYVQALRDGGKDNVEMLIDEPIFRNFSCIEPIGTYIYYNDDTFYKDYGKDYIFSSNGERIQTLGVVKVGAMSSEKQKKLLLDEWQQYDMRMAFLRGFTTVITYGQLWWENLINMQSAGFRSYEILKNWLIYGRNPGNLLGHLDPYIFNGKISDIPGMPDEYIERWNSIEHNSKTQQNEKASTLVYKGNYDRLQVYNGYYNYYAGVVNPYIDIQPIIIDYQFNIQTLVPFAPQTPMAKFTLPSYNVSTDLLKDAVDEEITRYWNPECILKSGERFNFSFPTAAGHSNTSYSVIIEGITTSGDPIYETYIINI